MPDTVAWLERHSTPGDVVFLASLRAHRLSSQLGPNDEAVIAARIRSPEQAEIRARALAEAVELVRELRALGLHVLVDAPKPVFRASPFRCADWFNSMNPACEPGFEVDRALLLAQREPAMESLRELRDVHGVRLWDPFFVLCPEQTCSAFEGAAPLFLDGDHLSAYGNDLLVASFVQQLRAIWQEPPGPRAE